MYHQPPQPFSLIISSLEKSGSACEVNQLSAKTRTAFFFNLYNLSSLLLEDEPQAKIPYSK